MAKSRLSVCAKCDDRVWMVCGICTCVLQAKARIPEEACPADKWPVTMDEIQRLIKKL